MRGFVALHKAPSLPAASGRSGGGYFKAAVFALACLAGAGFSAGEHSAARADDGGMMSFLLNGNGGGRARAIAPAFRIMAPAVRERASFARKVAVARAKVRARSARLALAHKFPKHRHPALAAATPGGRVPLVRTVSLDIAPLAEQKIAAQTLALKTAAAAARPDDVYLQDRTLRRGDIVATAAGLRVFLGAAHFPYKAHDFASVTSARRVAQRSDLEALDRALRGIRRVPHQKRIAKVATRIKLAAVAPRGVDTRHVQAKSVPAVQTVAMAYAPRTDIQGLRPVESPATQAIERVIRRIELAPAPRAATADRAAAARGARVGMKKSE